ncbi:RRM domain-containing protein [Mycena kentingensis (nom. inval.)]|nr:RRM domain-containing protein [Mycena kentingensis (nom. inval.)]
MATADKNSRGHAPRLRHSPSMPNMRSSSHSAPILVDAATSLKRPGTPPAPKTQPDASQPKEKASDSAFAKPSLRRRVDYEHPNVLLTPPLTPSSSLRTTTSVESRLSRIAALESTTDDGSFADADTVSTRYLRILNVGKDLEPQQLRFAVLRALESPSDSYLPQRDKIKGISTHFHPSQGMVILVFYDVRQAASANVILSTPTTGALAACVDRDQSWFDCSFVTAEEVVLLVGGFSFVMDPPPFFGLAVEMRTEEHKEIDIPTLIGLLKTHGSLRSFRRLEQVDKSAARTLYRVEFFDVRENEVAMSALQGTTYFGINISVLKQEILGQLTVDCEGAVLLPGSDIAPTTYHSDIRKPSLIINTGRRSPSASQESADSSDPSVAHSAESPPFFYTSTSPSETNSSTSDPHVRRGPNPILFDAAGNPYEPPSEDAFKRSRSESNLRGARGHQPPPRLMRMQDLNNLHPPMEYGYPMQSYCPTPTFPTHFHPPPTPHLLPPPGIPFPPSPHPFPQEFDPNVLMPVAGWAFDHAMMMPPPGIYGGMVFSPPGPPPNGEFWPGSPVMGPPPMGFIPYASPVPPETPTLTQPPVLLPPPTPTLLPLPANNDLVGPPPSSADSMVAHPGPPVIPIPMAIPLVANYNNDRNQLNISRIEDGQDTRTTVMVKNIPNKMSDKDLMAFIGSVCSRRVDFLYLRMDFQNGCNVGYAFVNFISVEDLLRFAKAKLGKKWNMFSSEKILQMSYANYQGKEALVEKFKNSCIMDERPAWQPKIFYSSGPEQGLPEPFPPPTHLRRKERSSFNRGPLYVPGMMGGGALQAPPPALRRHHLERPRPPRERERDVKEKGKVGIVSVPTATATAETTTKKANKK